MWLLDCKLLEGRHDISYFFLLSLEVVLSTKLLSLVRLFGSRVVHQPLCPQVSSDRILNWVAIPSSRGFSQARLKPESLFFSWLAGRFFTISTTCLKMMQGYIHVSKEESKRTLKQRWIYRKSLGLCFFFCVCGLCFFICVKLYLVGRLSTNKARATRLPQKACMSWNHQVFAEQSITLQSHTSIWNSNPQSSNSALGGTPILLHFSWCLNPQFLA